MADQAHALLIGADRIPCEIRFSPRRRTLAIEVHPEPRVIVRAPARCPPALIAARLAERRPWIERQVGRFRELAAGRPAPSRYMTGDSLLYIGEPHRLEVSEARRAQVNHVTGTLQVGVPRGAGPDRVRRALEAWYRARAQEVFGVILAERFGFFRDRGHACPTLTVRNMTTRWGSLAGRSGRGMTRWLGSTGRDRRRMTLNLALIRAPRQCIEYVVVHELCHMEHRGHGSGFYRLLDQLMPDWRAQKKRLDGVPGFGDS